VTSSKLDESWEEIEVSDPDSTSIMLVEFETSRLPFQVAASEVAASDPAAFSSEAFSSSSDTTSCCRSLVSSILV